MAQVSDIIEQLKRKEAHALKEAKAFPAMAQMFRVWHAKAVVYAEARFMVETLLPKPVVEVAAPSTLLSLAKELLDSGEFYSSAIERDPGNFMVDFEEYHGRLLAAVSAEESRSKASEYPPDFAGCRRCGDSDPQCICYAR